MSAIVELISPPDYIQEGPRNSGLWDKNFLLYLQDITAVFDGFKALDVQDFGVAHNELRVIIGPNGAGKTTMCDVISGKTRPTSGQVFYDTKDITEVSETDIALRGVGRKFQTPTVFDSLTTFENMELSLPGQQSVFKNLRAKVSQKERDRICSILERVQLLDDMHIQAKFLSHGQRQWLAISCLILSDAKLLLVDEPAAGLTDSETELTAELLYELRNDHTLVVIEHDMDFVRQLNSYVTVLNEGRIMAEGSLEQVSNNQEVVEAYLGR